MLKGTVYYTDNSIEDSFAETIRNRLKLSAGDIPIVWVSQKPIPESPNIVVGDIGRSHCSIAIQVLTGLQAMPCDVIYLAEHDVIYHPSHFDCRPKKKDKYYYNHNFWRLRSSDGTSAFKLRKARAMSQLVAFRSLLIAHFIKRVEREKSGKIFHRLEPGTERGRFGTVKFCSEWPNIDIRHGGNLTTQLKFGSKYILADGVPGWGKTKGRYKEFICQI